MRAVRRGAAGREQGDDRDERDTGADGGRPDAVEQERPDRLLVGELAHHQRERVMKSRASA
ncbi:hypothetical protein [Janibacter melonis]|uniref:hypothetical protein n=1 Tax=Janibacter melonis TaxID=262209 RepID=UPI0035578101